MDLADTVVGYGGIRNKRRREEVALDAFCATAKRLYRARYRHLAIGEALGHGLVKSVLGETVDGVLLTRGGPVAIELLGYSPLDDRGDVYATDEALRKCLRVQLDELLAQLPVSIMLYYRECQRPGERAGEQRKAVPPPRHFGQLVNELGTLLRRIDPPAFGEAKHIHFVPQRYAGRASDGSGHFSRDEFPITSQYVRQLWVQGLRVGMFPTVHSDLTAAHIGLDPRWTTRHLKRKADASNGVYQERANGLPLWLVVHSDGFATNQTIPEPHRPWAISLCQEVLRDVRHRFARAYWMDRTSWKDAAWIGRVI